MCVGATPDSTQYRLNEASRVRGELLPFPISHGCIIPLGCTENLLLAHSIARDGTAISIL